MIAVLLGAIVTEVFLIRLRRWQRLYPKLDDDPETRAVDPRLMGVIERFVFSLLVWWVGLTGATITGMFAWLALKLATNWTRPRDGSDRAQAKVIRLSQGALLAGVVSLMFAAWGGLVARSEAWPCSRGVLSLGIASTVAPNRDLSAKQRQSLSFRARQAYRGPRVLAPRTSPDVRWRARDWRRDPGEAGHGDRPASAALLAAMGQRKEAGG